MGVFNFLKSKVGKATMVGTTAAAGVATNFVLAEGVKDDMKLDAIKNGVEQVGGSVEGLSNAEILAQWDIIKNSVEYGTPSDAASKLYDIVMSNFDKINVESHYQPQTLTGTCAVVAVMSIVWAGAYFLAKRKAKKVAEVQVEDIQ